MNKKLLNLKDMHKQNYDKFGKIENISFINELAIGFSKKNNKISEVIDAKLQKSLAELSSEGLIKFKDGLYTLIFGEVH